METVHSLCCGLDVHQAVVAACLRRVNADGTVSLEHRSFGTTLRELMALSDWLVESGCPLAAMESTGVYWKPVYHVLSGALTVWVLNAQDVKQRRGKKTDRADAQWIAELLAHDLVQPSFVPPPEIGALRDLVRMRTALVQTRTQAKNRVLKTLEDTNVKLASVVSDSFGVSGRAMLEALIQGGRTPHEMAKLARGVLRKKIPQLEVALEGSFTAHHAALIRLNLESLDLLNRQIAELDERIGTLVEPLREQVERLKSIPGVNETAARTILSEIGTDMTRFVSAGRLASWAGLCPGNNESAGKHRSGRTRRGNRHLRRILAECAWATRHTDTFLGHTFRKLQARIGGKKAAVAVGHKILVIGFHLLEEGTPYEDGRYDRPNPREETRRKKQALDVLSQLGYDVTLKKTAA